MAGHGRAPELIGRAPARRRPTLPALIGLGILVVMASAAIAADQVAPRPPDEQHLVERLDAPAWLGGVGVVLGLLAGYLGGVWDRVLMRIADVQQAIPALVLAIAVVALLRPSLTNLIVVLAATTWFTFTRVVRSEVLSLREALFVEAARVIGARDARIIARHILPNVSASIIVISSLMVGNLILFESSLSFLGLGVPLTTPTWGRMVFDGIEYVATAWWIPLFPGVAVMLTVLATNLVGDWLRDALDPRQRAR